MKKKLIILGVVILLVGIVAPQSGAVEKLVEQKDVVQAPLGEEIFEFKVAYVTGRVIMERPKSFMTIFIAEGDVRVKCIIPHAENEQIFEVPENSYVSSGFAIWLHADRFPNSDVWEVTVLMISAGKVFTSEDSL